MQHLMKSLGSFAWAMPLFAVQQVTDALSQKKSANGGSSAAEALDAMTNASLAQCSDAIRETFETGDRLQQQIIDAMFKVIPADGMSGFSMPSSFGDVMPGQDDEYSPMGQQSPTSESPTIDEEELGWGPVPPVP